MNGRKIQQLKEAMEKILSDLNPDDYFSLLSFSSETKIWRLTGDGKWDGATLMESDWKSLVVPVNKTNVLRGKLAIQKLTADGGSKPPEPIIILLTDGEPTVGNCDINEIINEITRLNKKTKATIFTLGLGRDVDFNFLKKLALQNSGFCRKIYEASDTALQLMDFYKEVASPLVSDINFIYQPEQVNFTSLTTHIFPTYFYGTELIVCGVIDPNKEKDFHFNVTGLTTEGKRNFEPLDTSIVFIKDQMQKGFMERLWAYLTIQQLLEEEKRLEGKLADEKKKHATELALKVDTVHICCLIWWS
ncbi:Inter-alpha-trypsin inhibitor heavy chain H4 [Blattella germanica]|nr:Inter-alpha-trypsin inhibitor heavy chain H4 [Blattella germanica]